MLWKLLGGSVLDRIAAALTPSANEDPMVQLHWRWAVIIVLLFIIVTGIFSAAWIRGDIPGLSGVALASDLVVVDGKLTDLQNKFEEKITARQDKQDTNFDQMKLILIKSSLQQALKNRCVSAAAHNQQALENANNDITEYNDQFHMLRGYDYPELLTPCNVILINPNVR
jgi:hypothetical protein